MVLGGERVPTPRLHVRVLGDFRLMDLIYSLSGLSPFSPDHVRTHRTSAATVPDVLLWCLASAGNQSSRAVYH
eukprot:43920-Eustigmatos_ZCMA.PRE.1